VHDDTRQPAPFELTLALDRDAPEFARGVEVGMLYQRLRSEPLPLSAIVHADNAEMALRLAESFGVSACAEDLGDWLAVTYRSVVSPGTRPHRP
jgi:hypothetical protein